jgi:hypothetical protein
MEMLRDGAEIRGAVSIPECNKRADLLTTRKLSAIESRNSNQFCGTFSRKKVSTSAANIPRCGIALVVRHRLVHHAPQPLDRVQMRAIGWDEVKLDPSAGLRQPILLKLGMMVTRVVQVLAAP